MSAFGRQKWCKHGNQASTTSGHNLRMRACSACFLGMPAKFGGPGVGVYKPRAWSKIGAVKAMDSSVTLSWHFEFVGRKNQLPKWRILCLSCIDSSFSLPKLKFGGQFSGALPQPPGPPRATLHTHFVPEGAQGAGPKKRQNACQNGVLKKLSPRLPDQKRWLGTSSGAQLKVLHTQNWLVAVGH
eukprot:482383-Pelagomonas_calceolata.AAC.1